MRLLYVRVIDIPHFVLILRKSFVRSEHIGNRSGPNINQIKLVCNFMLQMLELLCKLFREFGKLQGSSWDIRNFSKCFSSHYNLVETLDRKLHHVKLYLFIYYLHK